LLLLSGYLGGFIEDDGGLSAVGVLIFEDDLAHHVSVILPLQRQKRSAHLQGVLNFFVA
jgi:hypothetical protein